MILGRLTILIKDQILIKVFIYSESTPYSIQDYGNIMRLPQSFLLRNDSDFFITDNNPFHVLKSYLILELLFV
jgi:hypothetical protein